VTDVATHVANELSCVGQPKQRFTDGQIEQAATQNPKPGLLVSRKAQDVTPRQHHFCELSGSSPPAEREVQSPHHLLWAKGKVRLIQPAPQRWGDHAKSVPTRLRSVDRLER